MRRFGRKKEGRRPRLAMILIFVVFFAVSLVWFFDQMLAPTLLRVAEARARVIATRTINSAISEKIAQSIIYENLVDPKVDSRGQLVLMQINTGEINRLASETTLAVQDALRNIQREPISIPLGQILGSQIFAAAGPRVTFNVVPVGTVESAVVEEFIEKGINQTLYRLHLVIKARISIVVPLMRHDVIVETPVPLTEVLIPGNVPQVYVGLDGSGVQGLFGGLTQ